MRERESVRERVRRSSASLGLSTRRENWESGSESAFSNLDI